MGQRQSPDVDPFAVRLFSNQLQLVAGRSRPVPKQAYTGPMKLGLKVAVLLEGIQSYQIDGDPALRLEGPTLFIALNDEEHIQTRTVLSNEQLRFAMVQVDLDFARSEFGAELDLLASRLRNRSSTPGVLARAAEPAMCALAVQMTENNVRGPMRNMYVGGKALELLALALSDVVGDEGSAHRLPARTVEQVQAARDILIQSAQNPPSLAELARTTGLNVSKLTSGFRQVFGMSAFAYLQEYRLQHAYELIRSGKMSVAEAAYHVGYNPAHFSGIFRKRFGVLPSNLR